MANTLLRGFSRITQTFVQPKTVNILVENNRTIFLQPCLYRAKKSTRERKLKLIKKRKAQKATAALNKPLVPAYRRKQTDASKKTSRIPDDTELPECEDNVWFSHMYKFRKFNFVEAVEALREINHPTMYNEPNVPLQAFIELDMSTDKKTKFYDNFVDVVNVKYPYAHKENRSILAFCKTKQQMDEAFEAGATLAGGLEIITAIKRGKIVLPDFEFVVAHPNILHDMVVIRGLLRKKFPSVNSGTLGTDLVAMINNLKIGIRYESKRDEFDPRYGWVDVQLGPLNMETAHLEDNFRLVLANIRTKGPKRTKNLEGYQFLKRCFVTTALQQEKLLVPIDDYLEPEEVIDSDDEDEVSVKK